MEPQVFRGAWWVQAFYTLLGAAAAFLGIRALVEGDSASMRATAILPFGLALYCVWELAFERIWSLTLDDDGVAMDGPRGEARLAWSEVERVELRPTANRRMAPMTIWPRKGAGRAPLRFLSARLSGADRTRLGNAFAERGFPLRLA